MSRARSSARRVSPIQFLSALVGFVLLSVAAGFLAAGLVLPAAAVGGATAKWGIEAFDDLPDALDRPDLPQQSNIYASDGTTLIATFFDQNRIIVPLEEISPWMQQAMVAIEDRRFWEHNGVDGEGLLRAVFNNASSGQTQGASTITQQLVKNTLINEAAALNDLEGVKAATEVSVARKLREAKLALALEAKYNEDLGTDCTIAPEADCGKERILEQYLNMAQFGASVYGVETAAQYYFGHSAAELTAIEAATIAGVTQNPFKWDPTRPDNAENAQDRRDTVLLVMRDQDLITPAEYDEYVSTPILDTLDVHRPVFGCHAAVDAPFFCDYVTKLIYLDPFFDGTNTDGVTGKQMLYYGVDIVTTLDITKQQIANQELSASLPSTDPTGLATALVALDPSNGHILVMSQNREFDPSPQGELGKTSINYAVDREFGGSRGFSPGSTFKVVILATWLNSGRTLEQAVSGAVREWPANSWTHCGGKSSAVGQRSWKPTNAGEGGAEQRSVLSATASSTNTSFVAMTNQLDLCDIAKMAETMGFERADGQPFEAVPSVALGTQNASPLTMAEVGATIASGGTHCEPRAIKSITSRTGTSFDVPPDDCAVVLQEKVALGVEYGMTQVINGGSGTAARLAGGRPAAGKTGTAQNNAHTWFLGYTPQMVAVVWLGHPDHDVSMQRITINGKFYTRVYGGTIAAPTWKRFMDRALEGQPKLGLQAGPPAGLGWVQLVVPEVRGELELVAQNMINDAGFFYAGEAVRVFDETFPAGTVIWQSAEPGSILSPGATVSYRVSVDTLPAWWFDWPSGWDPCVAPADWWGSMWPPTDWGPATGWNNSGCGDPDPDPDPDPTPTPTPTATPAPS